MTQRINITLPDETLGLIARLAGKRHRSRFIDEAVRHYVQATGQANLRRRIKEGAIRRASVDLQLAEEWFALEDESCRDG